MTPHERSGAWARRGGSLLRTAGTVIGTIAVLAVALGLVVTRDSVARPVTRTPSTPLPSPRAIARHGVSYRVAPTSPSGVVARPASRTVTVYAMDVEQRTDPACSVLDPSVRVVRETAGSVRIATFAYRLPLRGDGTRACSYVTVRPRTLLAGRRVRLREPLGHRTLVDDHSGKQFPVLDPDYVPTPAYVPSGYRQTWVQHYAPRDEFAAFRQFLDGTGSLEISAVAEPVWGQHGRVVGHARVAGSSAQVSDAGYERCVSWSPRAGLVLQVCSGGERGRFLPVRELLRVARGVR